MEEQNNIRIINFNNKPYKSFTEPIFDSNKKLYNYNTMTNLENIKQSKIHSENSKKKKRLPRAISVKGFFDHYDKKNCEYCKGIEKLVENDKSKLSSFIQGNSQYLNLFGNKRYNRRSPYLFVEDHKCGRDDDRIGLVPIPSKPRVIMKTPDENHNLYEIQRKIVMIRRFQYGKKNLSEPYFFSNQLSFYSKEEIYKIIIIQKMFRGFLVRKKVGLVMNFRDIINKWQEIFDILRARRFLRYLINLDIYKIPKNDNIGGANYISKIRRNKDIDLDNYQNHLIYHNKNPKNEKKKYKEDFSDNILQNINDLKKYSKKIIPKERVKNGSLLTKEYYDKKDTKDKIDKIENNYKNHINSKKNIFKKDDDSNNNNPKGLFIDKIYYSQLVQKVVNFNNIMRNTLQKAVFRKRPKKVTIDLIEEINNRIDIHPDNTKKNYVVKCKLKTNTIEAPQAISSKDFNFKNIGFFIDKVRIRYMKQDNKLQKTSPFSVTKIIELKKENEGDEKDKYQDNNVLSNNKELLIPKDKYCYMTKEYIKDKGKKNINEDKNQLECNQKLVIDPRERFNYKGNLKNKTSNEENVIFEENKNKVPLKVKNSDFNILNKKKVFPNDILIIDNNSSINYKGTSPKTLDKNTNILKNDKKQDPNNEVKEKTMQEKNINQLELNIQTIEQIHFKATKKEIKEKLLKQESNCNINFININPKIDKSKDFIIESIANINYLGDSLDTKKDYKLIIQKNYDLIYQVNEPKKNNIFIIEKNNIINYLRIQKDINNNIKMEEKDNFSFDGKNEPKKIDEDKNLIKENNNAINYQGLEEKIFKEENKPRQFNNKDIIISSKNTITYKVNFSKPSNEKNKEEFDIDKANQFINELYLPQKLNRKVCYLTKIYLKKDINDVNAQIKEEDNLVKRKDISNNDTLINGLVITKSRYKEDFSKLLPTEKIYKKPLFNDFFSYFIEEPLEEVESSKIKTRPKKVESNKKDSEENNIPKEEFNKFDKEKSHSLKKQIKNKNLDKIEEDSDLIKRIVPGKDSSEIFKIKPNHLLKIIKVGKAKATYEQYIHVGKMIPEKKLEKDEEFIYIRYKSKTPSKSQKKYIKNNLLKIYKEDEDVKKYYLPSSKKEINLKTKPKIEEDEESISDDYNLEYKKHKKGKKLIKAYKFNFNNYCYVSKIRKNNVEDDSKKEIIKIELDNEVEDKDKYIKKEEFQYNINHNCYCDKDIIRKSAYNAFLDYYKNLNQSQMLEINLDNKEEKAKKLNEKPINKLSLITKKRIMKITPLILDRTKLNTNKCLITKVIKRQCLTLPNPNYKNDCYIITKNRKKIISDHVEELKLSSEDNNNYFQTKEGKLSLPKEILIPNKKVSYIQKERKKLIYETNKMPLKNNCYFEKLRKKEMLGEIKTIQNAFRDKKDKIQKEVNLLFNNKDKNAFIPKIKSYFKEDEFNDQDNFIFGGYISKIIKRPIYKLCPPEQCFISKQTKLDMKKQPNYSYLSLLDFFIKKNIQEYVFPKLIPDKENQDNKILESNNNIDKSLEKDNKDILTYPKYYTTLRRIFNFYKTQKRDDSPETQKLYNELIPDIKDSKSLNDLIIKLNDNPENRDKIIDNQIEKDPNIIIDNNSLIDEIGEFVKYDKNLSNSDFIKTKLKENPEFKNNKNLFNIIKIVDDEYNNLINGKYCYKCGNELMKCKCDDINYIFKETEKEEDNENENEEEEDNLDFDLDNDEGLNAKKINYFEYDSNTSKGLQMINKPNLEDYSTQPKKVLQIYNKKQLNDINRNIMKKKVNSNDNSFNLLNDDYKINKPLNTENNYNQRYANYSNNIMNSMNSINDDYTFNENDNNNNKIILSSNNFKK